MYEHFFSVVLLFCVTACSYIVLRYSKQTNSNALLVLRILSLLTFVSSAVILFNPISESPSHMGILVFLSVLTILLSYIGNKYGSIAKQDALITSKHERYAYNTLLIVAIYPSMVIKSNGWLFSTCIVISLLSIFRNLKYRFDEIGDDSLCREARFWLFIKSYYYVMFSFAFFFVACGMNFAGDVISGLNQCATIYEWLFDHLYFSAITITTIGYGDMHPINLWVKFAVMLESTIGYIFLGTLLGDFLRYKKNESKPEIKVKKKVKKKVKN